MAAVTSCPARNLFVDLGVNWCNTLELWQTAASHMNDINRTRPWIVVGWEAAPLIAPFAERCTRSLNAGRPLPEPPLPPTGSSAEFFDYVRLKPSLRGCFLNHSKGGEELKSCVFANPKIRSQLDAIQVDPALTQNEALLQRRLASLRRCPPPSSIAGHAHYTLVPAAAGVVDGNVTLFGGIEQMLLGGARPANTPIYVDRHHHKDRPIASTVRTVDVVRWLMDSVREQDLLILKLDIEGEEHALLPALLKAGAARLIDLLLFECHHGHSGGSCWRLREQLLVAGLRFYVEPKAGCAAKTNAPNATFSTWQCTDWKHPYHLRSPADCEKLTKETRASAALCRSQNTASTTKIV